MDKINKQTGEQLDWCIEHTQGKSGYNKQGEEIPSDRPVALPVGFTRPVSLQVKMKHLLRNAELIRAQELAGIDTFEEADDFNVGEFDPLDGTPYEDNFDPEQPGAIAREQEIRSGFVQEMPEEKKRRAKNYLTRFQKNAKIPPTENPKEEPKNAQSEKTT